MLVILAAPLPAHIHQIHISPFHGTLGASMYLRTPHQLISERLQKELLHHDAKGNGYEAIRNILDIPKKDRYKYMTHLLNNPTVDLSVHDHQFAKTLVEDGDAHSLGLISNNPKYDLSFDDNHLLKLASANQNLEIVHLLLHDKMVRKILNQDGSSEDDELESLGFSKSNILDYGDSAITHKNKNKNSNQADAQSIVENNFDRDLLSFNGAETLDTVDLSDIESLKISLGISEKESKLDEEDYDLIDHDDDWEYLGSDDDGQSTDTKELISLLSSMKR